MGQALLFLYEFFAQSPEHTPKLEKLWTESLSAMERQVKLRVEPTKSVIPTALKERVVTEEDGLGTSLFYLEHRVAVKDSAEYSALGERREIELHSLPASIRLQ